MVKYLGYVAGLLTVISLLPQVMRTWRTKHTKDLSLRTFAMLTTASTLWTVYGVLSEDLPVIATNAGMMALNSSILFAKLRYRGRETDS